MLEKDADMEILKTTLQRKVDPASFIPSNAKSGNVIFFYHYCCIHSRLYL